MSALSDLAASMSPGQWAELTGNSTWTDSAFIYSGSHSGNIMPFAFSGNWDSEHRQMHFQGSDHGETIPKHVIYDADSNNFSLGVTSGLELWNYHGFDQQAIDPVTNRLYWRVSSNRTFILNYGDSSWSEAPTWNATKGINVALGTHFWSGSMTGTTAGAYFVYNSCTNGQVLIFNPITNTWISNGDDIVGFGGVDTYQCFADYSAVYNCGWFGGGGSTNGKKNWRLNADRTVTALADAPRLLGVQFGNVVCDPVSGNFLVISNSNGTELPGKFYEFNPTGTGTWTDLTAISPVPSSVGFFGDQEEAFSFPISNYGVVAYLNAHSNPTLNFWLYKHTASAPTPNLAVVLR